MPARPRIPLLPRRSLRRTVVTAAAALALVAVSLAVPAFAKGHTPPVEPVSSAKLQGGVAEGLSAPLGSFAPVPGRPADKPIGVPFEALSRAGGALIRIDDQDVPHTSDPNNFAIAVINRHTRAVVESGIVNHANTSLLTAIAEKYSGQNDDLMVISGFKGIVNDPGNTLAFTRAVRQLGGRDLTAAELALLQKGAAFSLVGVPGGTAGGAYISIDHGSTPDGNVYGYLQVNVANNLYGVVTAEYPTFNTTNTSTAPGQASIQFDHRTYTSDQLPAGQSGFFLLSFDNALRRLQQQTIITTGNDESQARSALNVTLPAFFAAAQESYGSTVVIRSIGHPTPARDGWSNAAGEIEKLGGNRLGFNDLGADGSDAEYSLVGSFTTPAGAVESNPVLGGTGNAAGALARNRDMVFTPVSGGTPAGVNTQLVDITYQTPQPFPAYTTGAPGTTVAGTAAADAYIGRALKLCDDAAAQPVCSVRTEFYLDYGADFAQASTDLESSRMDHPGDGPGFTAADYAAVRRHLGDELSMVNRVRAYFAGLQKPFGEAGQTGTIDINALTDAVVAGVSAPKGSATTSYTLGLIGKMAALGGFAGPPVSAVAAGVSAAFGLGAYLTQPGGTPQLATDVKVSADQLGAQVRAQMLAASRSLNGTAMLVVSDYGKLVAVTQKLPSDTWRLPNDTGPTLATLSLAVQQSAAEKLVPLAYPWLLRGTPERSPQSMSCGEYAYRTTRIVQVNIWRNEPSNTSLMEQHDYFLADGRAIPAPYWFAAGRITGDDITPPAGLGAMLFSPANAERGTLGLNLRSFLSPRVFGSVHQANDAAYHCDLR